MLVDAADYFVFLGASLRRARRPIVILGWDFDASIRLRREENGRDALTLGDLLRTLVEEHAELEVRILVWALSTIRGGSARAAIRALIIANEYLDAEIERLRG